MLEGSGPGWEAIHIHIFDTLSSKESEEKTSMLSTKEIKMLLHLAGADVLSMLSPPKYYWDPAEILLK